MRATCLLLWSALALAQAPPQDSRNTDIPDTDTHFMPIAFWRHASHGSLAQWEERKRFLRGQILSAAGLDPMPEKTPLNARIFGRSTLSHAARSTSVSGAMSTTTIWFAGCWGITARVKNWLWTAAQTTLLAPPS